MSRGPRPATGSASAATPGGARGLLPPNGGRAGHAAPSRIAGKRRPASLGKRGGRGVAASLLDRLEYAGGGPTYGDGIGVLWRQRLDVGKHLEARAEFAGVDRIHVGRVRPCAETCVADLDHLTTQHVCRQWSEWTG